jgi:hypothetical protein
VKPMSWAGILLIVLGVLVFAYQSIGYTHQKKVIDVGSVHVTKETNEQLPLPPIFGGLALVGGVVLLFMGAGGKS